MDFLPLVVAIALIWKIVDLVKLFRPNLPSKVVQALGFGVGIGVAFLLRETDFASSIAIGDFKLSDLNAYSTALFGSTLGGTASVGVDFKKAIDNGDTAKIV